MQEFTFPITMTASEESEAVFILTDLLELAASLRKETIVTLSRLAQTEPQTLDQLAQALEREPHKLALAKSFFGIK